MKHIEIVWNNGKTENLIDNDNTNLNEYVDRICQIFTSSNISVLSVKNEKSNISIILKSSEVSSIRVNEFILTNKNTNNDNSLENIDEEVITD